MGRKQTHFNQSLARGLMILQAFSAGKTTLTLTELSRITGMNRTAVQRFTDTLMALGFLGRNRHKEFYLGPKVLSLGFSYLHGSELVTFAESKLREFSEKTGKTVNMAILDDTEIVFVFRNEVRKFLKYDLRPGSRLPSHCTASGKLLLAALEDAELKARIDRMPLEKMTGRTITDKEELLQEIMATRERTFSICNMELSPALYSIGVPILDHRETVVAAVNMSLSSEENDPEVLDRARDGILEQGRMLSRMMGYTGKYPFISAGPSKGGVS